MAGDTDAKEVKIPSLETRIGWVDEWEDATLQANQLARRDRDYVDNHQLTKEQVEKLRQRKQPEIVKNRIARKVNFILGEEDRKRINPVAHPRNPEDVDAARAATDALRYVADEQRFDEARSAMFRSMLVEGVGGLLVEVEDEGEGQYRHKLTAIEFDRLCYDQHSRSVGFDDARWMGVILWMDVEDAVDRWPDAEDIIRQAVNKASVTSTQLDDAPRAHQWTSDKRHRVKLAELFFRVGKDWYRSVSTDGADIEPPEQTWLRDDKGRSRCPLVLMSCYVDAENQRYGIVRSLISPQDEVNKRSSKALHQLNVTGAVGEEGSVRDPHKFLSELAKPDGFAVVEHGALQDGRVQIRTSADLSVGQMQLLQEAKQDIDTIGPSAATMPELPNGSSGVAFARRQQAAAQELGAVFRQLHNASMRVFELDWLCVRQYWTDEKWLRVTDDQELTGYRFTALNQRMTRAQRLQSLLEKDAQLDPRKALGIAAGTLAPLVERDIGMQMTQIASQLQQAQAMAQQSGQPPPPQVEAMAQQVQDPKFLVGLALRHPLMQEPITVNQVSQMTVDIVLDEAPDTAVMQQEEFATLAELLPTIAQARPDVAPKLVSLMIKASSLPDKRDLMKILDEKPDPQAAQAQQQAQQLGMALQQANVQVAETQAQLNAARAQGEQARSQVAFQDSQVAAAKAPAEVELTKAKTMSEVAKARPTIVVGVPHV